MGNEGKKVAVHYEGTLDDGSVFDSSYKRGEPLRFTCMAGQMIKGFDLAVKDMNVGDVVNVHLSPAEAYGEKDPRAVRSFPLSQIGMRPGQFSAGQTIYLQGPQGPMPSKIEKIDNYRVTLDMNHEMAGKALNFKIELLSVE